MPAGNRAGAEGRVLLVLGVALVFVGVLVLAGSYLSTINNPGYFSGYVAGGVAIVFGAVLVEVGWRMARYEGELGWSKT